MKRYRTYAGDPGFLAFFTMRSGLLPLHAIYHRHFWRDLIWGSPTRRPNRRPWF